MFNFKTPKERETWKSFEFCKSIRNSCLCFRLGIVPTILDFDTRRRSMTIQVPATLLSRLSNIQRQNCETINTHTSVFILHFDVMLVRWLVMEYQVRISYFCYPSQQDCEAAKLPVQRISGTFPPDSKIS